MIKRIVLFLTVLFLLTQSTSNLARDYKGAEYRTKEQFLYGRFEVRYIPANREGVVSSFFTYRDPDSVSADWNEIDIEFVGRYNNIIQFNSITPGQTFHIRSNHLNFNPYLDFHTYAFEWTPDYVAWFVDGQEVYRQTEAHVSTLKWPQNIMMNIWNPVWTNWVGYWEENTLPAFSYYDFVSYSAYTPGEGDSGTNNNFTLEWKDEFDEWDENRWEAATHTFPGNQCDFLPANITFENGNMILALTNEVDTGYVDNTNPEVRWARENFDNSISIRFSEEIDEITATNPENYLISGVEVTEALISTDKMNVTIFTNNYNKENTYTLLVRNINDDNSTPNQIQLRGTTIIKSEPLEFPIKINVGGESLGEFLADQEFSQNSEYGYWAGDVYYWANVSDVQNTEDDEIFKSERVGISSYKVRVSNGSYKVSLLFAKNENTFAGDRIFDIIAEDQLVQDDLDIFTMVGGNTAYIFETEVSVLDEKIDVYFSEETDSAFVNGIIVDQISTGIEKTEEHSYYNYFKLHQNYPNPFNPSTRIGFNIKYKSQVEVVVYDLLGTEIVTLINKEYSPGKYEVNFDASNLSSGIYFSELVVDGQLLDAKKMVLLK